MKNISKLIIIFLSILFLGNTYAFSRGIYITQSTAQNAQKLNYLISQSKKYGIDTFIIDINVPNKTYAKNVENVVKQGVHYIARVVIFPKGGTHSEVVDTSIWAKRLALAKYAIGLGASSIQLDYIRFRAENPANPDKAKRIVKVVEYFKNQLASSKVSLQMDIFGVAAHKPAHTIGQDVGVLAHLVNAFCPMVYPSHYEPYLKHAVTPYETIFNSVTALKKQLINHPAVSVFAYIELYNYRFPLTLNGKIKYITAEIKAAHDSGANGWYVWSPTNHYAPLFQVLAKR